MVVKRMNKTFSCDVTARVRKWLDIDIKVFSDFPLAKTAVFTLKTVRSNIYIPKIIISGFGIDKTDFRIYKTAY